MQQRFAVRDSSIHGKGVFATSVLPRRTFLAHYEGKRYGPGHLFACRPDSTTYLFALSDGDTIDGSEGGNATRFINHSCSPNCVAVEVLESDDLLVIEIRTKKSIQSGEELSLDYELVLTGADPDDYRCRCGSARCRGTMLGPKPSRRRDVSCGEAAKTDPNQASFNLGHSPHPAPSVTLVESEQTCESLCR